MPDCLFCSIVAGSTPAAIVGETEHTMAFLDHAPLFPGHTLVVPRAHLVTIEDLTPELQRPFLAALARVARAVRLGTGSEGTMVLMNNIVSQSVPHLHAHVVPRTKGDGLRGFMWPRHRYPDEAAREAVRQAIARQYSDT